MKIWYETNHHYKDKANVSSIDNNFNSNNSNNSNNNNNNNIKMKKKFNIKFSNNHKFKIYNLLGC